MLEEFYQFLCDKTSYQKIEIVQQYVIQTANFFLDRIIDLKNSIYEQKIAEELSDIRLYLTNINTNKISFYNFLMKSIDRRAGIRI